MIGSIRLESDFLRANASLFEKVHPRADAVVFLPFRNWVKDTECKASRIAAELSRANVQFKVFDEDDFRLEGCKVLLASSSSDFTKAERERVDKFVARGGKLVLCDLTNWLAKVQTHIGTPSIQLEGPTGVRAVVGEQPGKTIVHLLNLNVQKISSFEDKVTPVKDLKVTVRVPFRKVRSVRLLTADEGASEGEVKFERVESNGLITVVVTMPRLEIASILVMR